MPDRMTFITTLGTNGFIPGSRASLMMDIVVTGMLVVLPVLAVSVWAVKKRLYARHRTLQLGLATLLVAVLTLFELDVRLNGWMPRAEPSAYYGTWVFPILYVHLIFAISTSILWIITVSHGLRRMGNPPSPGAHSAVHKRLGRMTAATTFATALTGWTFYFFAFIA